MEPVSRIELLAAGVQIEPVSRLEKFVAAAAGTYELPEDLKPVSRLEYFLSQVAGGGGGGVDLRAFIFKPPYENALTFGYASQEVEAPESVAYDKVKVSDNFASWILFGNELLTWYTGSTPNQYPRMSHYSKLATMIYSGTAQLQSNCFSTNSSMKTLVLLRKQLVSLQNVNAFTGTPFASSGSGGTLYVPESLIESYQSATNWSTILGYANNSIAAIEGSIYEEVSA